MVDNAAGRGLRPIGCVTPFASYFVAEEPFSVTAHYLSHLYSGRERNALLGETVLILAKSIATVLTKGTECVRMGRVARQNVAGRLSPGRFVERCRQLRGELAKSASY